MENVSFTRMEDGTREDYEFLSGLWSGHHQGRVADHVLAPPRKCRFRCGSRPPVAGYQSAMNHLRRFMGPPVQHAMKM